MVLRPDPFWRRSGFWAAVVATVPLVYSALDGGVPMPLTISVIGAWAAFFMAKGVRPSNSNAVVMGRLAEQQTLIKQLRAVNAGQREDRP